MQLTFWDTPLCPERNLWESIYDIKEKQNNLRRGIFSRHDHLVKEVASLKKEIEDLKMLMQYEDISYLRAVK